MFVEDMLVTSKSTSLLVSSCLLFILCGLNSAPETLNFISVSTLLLLSFVLSLSKVPLFFPSPKLET